MKIALCDDDEKELAGLKTMLHHYGAKHHKPLTYKEYTSSVELASQAPKERFDLYLLDIIMPRLTGVELAREIRSFDKAASIIFLTTSPEFAVESYTVKATNYLMKPVQEETFFAAMDDLLHDKVEEQDHYVVLNSKIVYTKSGCLKLFLSKRRTAKLFITPTAANRLPARISLLRYATSCCSTENSFSHTVPISSI